MAHLVKLHQLNLSHENKRDYKPVIFNLDMVISIEKSNIHSIIFTKNNNNGIRVKESLEDILKLSSDKIQ